MNDAPNNADAEAAVLGAVLLQNDLIDEVCDQLSPGDFYSSFHRAVFRAMVDLSMSGNEIDYLTVGDSLSQSRVDFEQAWISALTDHVPTTAHVNSYVSTVRGYSVKRKLIDIAKRIELIASGPGSDPDQLIIESQNTFDGLDPEDTRSYSAVEAASVAVEYSQQLATPRYRFSSGSSEFDRYAPVPEDLFIVMAESSVGKTSFMAELANSYAKKGKNTLVFSAEMSVGGITHKLVANFGKISSEVLKNPESPELMQMCGAWSKLPVTIDTETRTEKIVYKIAKLAKAGKCDVVFVDHLQFLEMSDKERGEEQVSESARALKKVARSASVPVILLSQISVVNGKPMVAWSRRAEQDTDKKILIEREYCANIAEATVLKNRQGRTGGFNMRFIDGNMYLPR